MVQRFAILKAKFNPFGGTEKIAVLLAKALTERGIHVDIYTSDPRPWPKILGANLLKVPSIKLTRWLHISSYNKNLNKSLNRNQYLSVLSLEHTSCHTHKRAGGGCHIAWLNRRESSLPIWRRRIMWSDPYHRLILDIERKGFTSPWVKKIIANSKLVKKEVMEFYGVPQEKIAVVYNGVEWEALQRPFLEALMGKEGLRRRMNLDPSAFYFLFVGNGFERKGLGPTIKALRFLPKDVSLLVVGYDKREGNYRKLASELGLQQRVIFYGPQRDVHRFHQVADAFILPTLYDPFSNATLEALAMGLFVITTSDNGCSEVLRPESGIVIDSLNEEAVAEGMKKAISTYKDPKGIRQSVKHLNLENQISKLIEECLT
ncbi:MAG: hypothetical protein DRG31_00260 [Deltaproteobacteria bacterium]|nr:MAG: hypothetical protein DRG31_00260 [Deltaproteobacteria bacterium]